MFTKILFFFAWLSYPQNFCSSQVVYSRVARICKNDVGGSQRVLEKHWTSFVKARFNCSVPGESFFYFDVLQSITDIININGVPSVVGVFTTQMNRWARVGVAIDKGWYFGLPTNVSTFPQHPRLSCLCLLHGRHRESVLGALQRAEDPRLCVDSISWRKTTQTQVRLSHSPSEQNPHLLSRHFEAQFS